MAGDQFVEQLRHPPPRSIGGHDQREPERRRGHFGDEGRGHDQLFAKRQRLHRDDDGHQRPQPGVDDRLQPDQRKADLGHRRDQQDHLIPL